MAFDDDTSAGELNDNNTETSFFPVKYLNFLFPHCFSLVQFVPVVPELLSVNLLFVLQKREPDGRRRYIHALMA